MSNSFDALKQLRSNRLQSNAITYTEPFMGKVINLIITIFSFPVIALNWMWIPALIWLIVLKEWGFIAFELFVFFITSQIGFLLLPLLIPAHFALKAAESKNIVLLTLFSAICVFYTDFAMSAWAVWVIYTVLSFVKSSAALIPALIVAYSCATGPWIFFASKEADNPHAQNTALFFCIANIILLITLLLIKVNLLIAMCILMVCMAPFTLYSLILEMQNTNRRISAGYD